MSTQDSSSDGGTTPRPGALEAFDERVFEFLAAGLRPLAVPGSLRDRVLGPLAGRNRFVPFLERMMSLCDLPEREAEGHLHSVDDDAQWDDMLPGIRYRDFDVGPAHGEAHGGLVRLQPGEMFPLHTHVGEERVLVLQGELVDDAGNHHRAGDLVVSADGSSHALRAVGEQEVIYAAVVTAIVFAGSDEDDDEDDD